MIKSVNTMWSTLRESVRRMRKILSEDAESPSDKAIKVCSKFQLDNAYPDYGTLCWDGSGGVVYIIGDGQEGDLKKLEDDLLSIDGIDDVCISDEGGVPKNYNVIWRQGEDDSLWWGVDFDGTLSKYDEWRGVDHTGDPIAEIVNKVKMLLNSGVKVKVFTARVSGDDAESASKVIRKWCVKNIGVELPVTNEKDKSMIGLIDDKLELVGVEQNTGVLKESCESSREKARKQCDTNPSDSQKETGNYRKGHFTWKGLPITIENPKGSIRKGKDKNGSSWRITMKADYGYFKKAVSEADKDHVDVFIGDDLSSEAVFVVNQNKPSGRFDEQKVIATIEGSKKWLEDKVAVETFEKKVAN